MTSRDGPQAVILCGGLGARLGALTSNSPKPLLPVGDQPFLQRLLFEITRHGVWRVVLLAAYRAELVQDFAQQVSTGLLQGLQIEVVVEPHRAGTGGALHHAREKLDEEFFLFNGDSWFDINLLDLAARARQASWAQAYIALREVTDGSRYGNVTLEGDRITSFGAGAGQKSSALVNAGVYWIKGGCSHHLRSNCSIERNVFPILARHGELGGAAYSGFFLDIGVPDAYREAQASVPARQRRPAAFLDCGGILNEDSGYAGSRDRFSWRPGAIEMVKRLNDAGYFVFVSTNRSGVANSKSGEVDVVDFSDFMRAELAKYGAHIDDIRYCQPHHPNHPERYALPSARGSDRRKPESGTILDLMRLWPVDRDGSFLTSDKEADMFAAHQAGLRGIRISPEEKIGDIIRSFA